MKALPDKTEILIVGAGLSGLFLASLLQDQKRPFQIVEARQRIGGRILTQNIKTSESKKNYFDLGPSWVWPGQLRVARLISLLNLSVFEQFSDGTLVYEDESGSIKRDLNYSTMAGSLRINGGMSELVEGLANRIDKTSLYLGHQLKSIDFRNKVVSATVQSDEGKRVIEAENLILCMPPRVIASSINFRPTLSGQVIRSMQQIPTWMAGHAKFIAVYDYPFWREMGLSGDAMSRLGPLMEIHDASPQELNSGALFGFVGVPAHSPQRDEESLKKLCLDQLIRLFGEKAANPTSIALKDWATNPFTATAEDNLTGHHPDYGLPSELKELESTSIYLGSTETAIQFGGFIEGALEAAENVFEKLLARQ